MKYGKQIAFGALFVLLCSGIGWWVYNYQMTPNAFVNSVMEDARNGEVHLTFGMRYEHFDDQMETNRRLSGDGWFEPGDLDVYRSDRHWLVFARAIESYSKIEHFRVPLSLWDVSSAHDWDQDMIDSYFARKDRFQYNADSTLMKYRDEPIEQWVYVYRVNTATGPVRQQVHVAEIRSEWRVVGAAYEPI